MCHGKGKGKERESEKGKAKAESAAVIQSAYATRRTKSKRGTA